MTDRETLEQLIDRAEVMLMSRSHPPNAENLAADLDERTQLGYDLLAALRAAPAPPDVIEDLVVALRSLAYAAMTSGGTKGPDVALKDAIRWATDALQKYDKLRAAPAPEGETPWRDISTAPTDKTEVDLWITYQFGLPHRVMNAWRDSQGVWLQWATATDGRYPTPIGGKPTHWMPAPASPGPTPLEQRVDQAVAYIAGAAAGRAFVEPGPTPEGDAPVARFRLNVPYRRQDGLPPIETTHNCLYTQAKPCKELSDDPYQWCGFCGGIDTAEPIAPASPGPTPEGSETWQPIETAPKNAYVLVFAENTVGVARFHEYAYKPEGWWSWDWEPDAREIEPTHWMPLPIPPSALTGGTEEP
jgi:hypothetical protein